MPKRVVTGVVTSDKMAKTRRVEIPRLVRHPQYGKILRRRRSATSTTRDNESHSGDMVEIVESRPLSRTKRWELVRVVTQEAGTVDIAAMRAAARGEAEVRARRAVRAEKLNRAAGD